MVTRGPGRPNQGKTKTIRKRSFNVYLPTEELLKEWKENAKEAGMSLSQFILEAVERQRGHGTGPHLPKLELEKTLKETNEELSELQSKYFILEAAFEKRDQDAKQLSKVLEHRETDPINTELAKGIIEGIINWPADSHIDPTEIIENLGISYKDKDKMAQIREIATFLENLGLIKTHFLGWDWTGDRKYKEDKKLMKQKWRKYRDKTGSEVSK